MITTITPFFFALSFRSSARPWPGVSWRRAAMACAAACMALAAVAQSAEAAPAAAPGLRIESFKVLSANAASAQIEFVAIRSDEHAEMLLGVIAKSRDGTRFSAGFPPALVPDGKEVRFTATVMRPDDVEARQTDYLLVFAYQGGEQPFMRAKLEWPHAWPADPSGAGISAQDAQAQQTPYAIFNANLTDEDFPALDALLEKWNTPQARDEDGDWKLEGFRSALDTTPGGTGWDEHLARIQRWKKANPRSAGAAIAEARHWADYARHILGCRCDCGCRAGEAVDPVAMRVFRQRMKRAEQVLLASKQFAASNPLWYQAYLDVAIDSGRSEQFIEKLFDEAVRRHPLYQPLYASMALYWAPRNGSRANWNEVETLADRAVKLTRATDGEDNYAWLYARVSARQQLDLDIMQDGAVSWPRMRDSFEDLVKRYPSAGNLNTFALFACRARDKTTYLNLSVKIRDHVVPYRWPNNYSIDVCNHRFMQES